jgi:hypothetical protein
MTSGPFRVQIREAEGRWPTASAQGAAALAAAFAIAAFGLAACAPTMPATAEQKRQAALKCLDAYTRSAPGATREKAFDECLARIPYDGHLAPP